MDSITYNSDEQVQAMLDKFDEISNSENTTKLGSLYSFKQTCNCGCQLVEYFGKTIRSKNDKYFIKLCKQHEITFDHDEETTTPKGT